MNTGPFCYRFAGDMISQEVREIGEDLGDWGLPVRATWRERAAAGREVGVEELPDPDEQKLNDWELLIICLEDHVLWDNDFEMVGHLDAAPQVARRVKRQLGIADDYFVAIPPDPSDAEAEQLLAELLTLTDDAR